MITTNDMHAAIKHAVNATSTDARLNKSDQDIADELTPFAMQFLVAQAEKAAVIKVTKNATLREAVTAQVSTNNTMQSVMKNVPEDFAIAEDVVDIVLDELVKTMNHWA